MLQGYIILLQPSDTIEFFYSIDLNNNYYPIIDIFFIIIMTAFIIGIKNKS